MEGLILTESEAENICLHTAKITITKELFNEAFPLTQDPKTDKRMKLLAFILLSTGIIALAAGFVFHIPLIFGLPFVFMACIILYWSKSIPDKKKKSCFQLMSHAAKGGPIIRCIVFRETDLEVFSEGNNSTIIPYGDIAKTAASDNLVVLMSKDKKAVILPKDDFTQKLSTDWFEAHADKKAAQ